VQLSWLALAAADTVAGNFVVGRHMEYSGQCLIGCDSVANSAQWQAPHPSVAAHTLLEQTHCIDRAELMVRAVPPVVVEAEMWLEAWVQDAGEADCYSAVEQRAISTPSLVADFQVQEGERGGSQSSRPRSWEIEGWLADSSLVAAVAHTRSD
jgi:hypothetical protein